MWHGIGSLSNDYGEVNKKGKKIGLDWQNSDTHHAFLYDCDMKMLAYVAPSPRTRPNH